MRRPVEIALVAVMLAVLAGQLLSHPITTDPDPDGYVSYAEHLKATWALPERHRRLPGYPIFLAVVDVVGPGTMHEDAYWAQLGLYVAWAALLWWLAWRHVGRVAALVLLAILAGPSYLARFAVVMVADMLGGVLMALAVLALLGCMRASSRARAWGWMVGWVLLSTAAYLAHPSARLLLPLVALGLAAGVVTCRGRVGRRRLPVRLVLVRLGVALSACVVATSAASALADRGSNRYNTTMTAIAVLVCAPPAVESDVDARIEAAKAAASARLGGLVQRATTQYYPELAPIWDLTTDARQAIATGRAATYPGIVLACNARQTFWRWHITAREFAPFMATGRLVTLAYLPETGSPRSTLFRRGGLEIPDADDDASWADLRWPILREVGRVLATTVPLLVGAVVLVRRFGAVPLGILLAFALWLPLLIAVVVLDGRYVAPFGPAIVLAQAVGLVAMVRRVGDYWFQWRRARESNPAGVAPLPH